MEIFEILAILIIAAFLSVVLKQYKPEYAVVVSIAAGIAVLLFALEKLITSVTALKEKIEEIGVKPEYFSVSLKALGLAYISSFIADVCRDCKEESLAAKAEIAGKCAIFVLCVPLGLTLLDTVLGFV